MKLEIDTGQLYDVLVGAEIDSNDAKAIIYDLIMASEGKYDPQKPRRSQISAPSPKSKREVSNRQERVEEDIEPQIVEDESVESYEPDSAGVRPTKVRRRKVHFGAFGGEAEPLK